MYPTPTPMPPIRPRFSSVLTSGQQRVVEDQPRLEADDGDHEQEEREALRGLGEEEGRADAQDGGDGEEREAARRLVADRAEHRRQDEDDRRGDGGERPDDAIGLAPSRTRRRPSASPGSRA